MCLRYRLFHGHTPLSNVERSTRLLQRMQESRKQWCMSRNNLDTKSSCDIIYVRFVSRALVYYEISTAMLVKADYTTCELPEAADQFTSALVIMRAWKHIAYIHDGRPVVQRSMHARRFEPHLPRAT